LAAVWFTRDVLAGPDRPAWQLDVTGGAPAELRRPGLTRRLGHIGEAGRVHYLS